MYKRHEGQTSLLETPEMFGMLPLDPKNKWVRLSKLVPWLAFEEKYAANFKSRKGQRACSARMALGSLLIKERNRFSDDDVIAHLRMNPYFQYFIGLQTFQYDAPFDASMLSRFRQRITPDMLDWVNDEIIGRAHHDDGDESGSGEGGESSGGTEAAPIAENSEPEGTLILDATCSPQNIRFPTDTSLLNEARENAEEIIDILHSAGLADGKKPRTYREIARKEYNSFSKRRKKTKKQIRHMCRKLLCYLGRDLESILRIRAAHPKCLRETLPPRKLERLAVLIKLYEQQKSMYDSKTHHVENRIVSLAQHWVRPIVRGKQNADVEFGAKIEMSVADGYLRVEEMRWDAFNESTTLEQSVASYRRAYGHYPARILADTIFRTRANLRYCKERGIRMSGPRLGRRTMDDDEYRQQRKTEWLESGERGEIERDFGVGKRRYTLGCVMTKLKHTSEVSVRVSVLTMNLWRKLRLLFVLLYGWAYRTVLWIVEFIMFGNRRRDMVAA